MCETGPPLVKASHPAYIEEAAPEKPAHRRLNTWPRAERFSMISGV